MQEVMQPYILPTQKPMMPDNSDNTAAILKGQGSCADGTNSFK
jgi:hypothetical protein